MRILRISVLFMVILFWMACSNQPNNTKVSDDTLNSGTIKVSVDESLKPLMEAAFFVFQYRFPQAKLEVSYKPEKDVLEDMMLDSARAIIITRELTNAEMEYYKSIQYVPRSMPFALDGLSLIANKQCPLDSISVTDLQRLLQGQKSQISAMVFESGGSGALRWLRDSLLHGGKVSDHCFSVNSHPEIFQYVMEHPLSIGVVGTSWLSDLDDSLVRKRWQQIKRLKVGLEGSQEFFEPFQSDIASGQYPLSRTVYCIQRDGKMGLGTGLQRFLYDETGQVIVLKYGLMPYKQPERSVRWND